MFGVIATPCFCATVCYGRNETSGSSWQSLSSVTGGRWLCLFATEAFGSYWYWYVVLFLSCKPFLYSLLCEYFLFVKSRLAMNCCLLASPLNKIVWHSRLYAALALSWVKQLWCFITKSMLASTSTKLIYYQSIIIPRKINKTIWYCKCWYIFSIINLQV